MWKKFREHRMNKQKREFEAFLEKDPVVVQFLNDKFDTDEERFTYFQDTLNSERKRLFSKLLPVYPAAGAVGGVVLSVLSGGTALLTAAGGGATLGALYIAVSEIAAPVLGTESLTGRILSTARRSTKQKVRAEAIRSTLSN